VVCQQRLVTDPRWIVKGMGTVESLEVGQSVARTRMLSNAPCQVKHINIVHLLHHSKQGSGRKKNIVEWICGVDDGHASEGTVDGGER